MCGPVSSPGNYLGVWDFERDGCWYCVSVRLHHPQLAPGNKAFITFLGLWMLVSKIEKVDVYGHDFCYPIVAL